MPGWTSQKYVKVPALVNFTVIGLGLFDSGSAGVDRLGARVAHRLAEQAP